MFSKTNASNLLNSLETPAYSVAFTSRIVGITRWRVARYLRGYFEYQYNTRQPPVVEQSRKGCICASFLDLVDLLYVKEFIRRGMSLQRVRLALEEAKKYLGTPHFARSTFYTSKNEIVLKLPKDGVLIALLTGGQITIPEITEILSDKLDFENVTEFGFVNKFYPRTKEGMIVIDPQISFGRPTLIGHGTATANIYDFYLGENQGIQSASDWFNIPIPQIKTAVQFEHSLCV